MLFIYLLFVCLFVFWIKTMWDWNLFIFNVFIDQLLMVKRSILDVICQLLQAYCHGVVIYLMAKYIWFVLKLPYITIDVLTLKKKKKKKKCNAS